MKRLHLAFVLIAIWVWVLFLPVPIYAAPAPDGFAGVPWGTTQEQVINMMRERGWREAEEQDGKTFYGDFAGFPSKVFFEFTANAMTGGTAQIEIATNGYHSKIRFDEAYKLLSEKYGQTDIKVMHNEDRRSTMPNYYNAEWNIVDDVSSDKYSIRLGCGDSVYLHDRTQLDARLWTRLYIVGVSYTNQSLVEKKKSSAY
jgi:hypothetical protein